MPPKVDSFAAPIAKRDIEIASLDELLKELNLTCFTKSIRINYAGKRACRNRGQIQKC